MLVNCVAYRDGRKLKDIRPEEIAATLSESGCFVWVGVRDSDAAELKYLQQQFGLHELAVEDAHHGHQRPKLDEYGDALFAVLHVVEFNGSGELEVGELAVFAGENYVLSARQHFEHGFQEVRARCERNPELMKHGPGFVLYALMDSVVDRYLPVLDTLEAELLEVEDRMFERTASPRELIEELYSLKRRMMVLQHAAVPLLESVSNLLGSMAPRVCHGLKDYYRDVYDHLLRVVKTIEARREMVTTAIQVNLSLITLAEGEVTKRLASYAALFPCPR